VAGFFGIASIISGTGLCSDQEDNDMKQNSTAEEKNAAPKSSVKKLPNARKLSNQTLTEPKDTKDLPQKTQEPSATKKKKRLVFLIISLCVLFLVIEVLLIVFKAVVNPPSIATDIPVFADQPQATNQPVITHSPEPTAGRLPLRKDDFYTFIMVGKDQVSGLTDTIILGALDNKNKQLNLVSIPRDTLVNVPWTLKKANSLLRDYKNGAEGLKEGIRDLAGFTVDSYIIVDLNAFVALVDAIDGVDFDVPQDMFYNDPTQDLYIQINAGYQHLTGEQAMKVFRYRAGYWNADIGRIETQQQLLKAIAQKSLKLENFDIRAFADIFKEYVETDLDTGTIIWYGQQLLSLDDTDIFFQTIPANYYDTVNGLSYCTIYTDEWLEVINECLNPYNREITAEHINIVTRDENGAFYATSGVIEGGAGSVRDVPLASEEPAQPDTEVSPEPSEHAVSSPEGSDPAVIETMPAESQNPQTTEDPAATGPLPNETQGPEPTQNAETQPPESTQNPETAPPSAQPDPTPEP
jgi:LCP family protein required for cell wall assembly